MKKYFNKVTVFLTFFFILIIILLQTYYYNEFNNYKERNIQHRLNEKILYISFLVHKQESQLQDLLIDISKDSLTVIDLDEISTNNLNKICTAWNDEVFRKNFKEALDEQTIAHLNKKCK